MKKVLCIFLMFSAAVNANEYANYKFECDFNDGEIYDFQKNKFSESKGLGKIRFTNINSKNQTAKIIGNAGENDVHYLAGTNGFGVAKANFIEMSETGNIFTTTIFVDKNSKSRKFSAVHSRHISIADGLPIPSINTGYCKYLY